MSVSNMDSSISPFESPKSLRIGSVGGSDWGPKASHGKNLFGWRDGRDGQWILTAPKLDPQE